SETAFAAKAFCESIGFVISDILLQIFPPTAYPIFLVCMDVCVLYHYHRWRFPLERMVLQKYNHMLDKGGVERAAALADMRLLKQQGVIAHEAVAEEQTRWYH